MLQKVDAGITYPKGFKGKGVKCGIKNLNKEDLAIIKSEKPAVAAALFTTNKMKAAPIIVSENAMQNQRVSAIVVNSGCANACTGETGLKDAMNMAAVTAEILDIRFSDVLVASTGVIGVNLPMEKIYDGLEEAALNLDTESDESVLRAIMTTDTFPKQSSYEFMIDGREVRIAGIAKGSGMICPNMATMLCFITTDVNIEPEMLKKALNDATNLSFNMITVDGDTSTNDMVCVLASGESGNEVINIEDCEGYKIFAEALNNVCIDLAKLIIIDGEGATKFLEINVKGAKDFKEAKQAAMSIAKSPLVKTAFFGEDPNWGRIVCAAGYADVDLDADKISLTIDELPIVIDGQKSEQSLAEDFQKNLKEIMAQKEIVMTLDLAVGQAEATVWTCDFSYDYVKINGEYTT